MRRLAYWLCLLVFLPGNTQASSASSLGGFTCTGTEAFSLTDVASLSCTGDLSLFGGTLNSDSRIEIHADGLLDLNNVELTAPSIDLYSGSSLIIEANSIIGPTDQLTITANQLTLDGTLIVNNNGSSGGNNQQLISPDTGFFTFTPIGITFPAAPVPLPASFWLMLPGLMLLRKKLSEKN